MLGATKHDCAIACYPWIMDRDLSDQLTSQMAIVPHETIAGVECCGCIVAAVEGTNVELRCNECGAVVGVVQVDILRGFLGLECAQATCPHCGKLNSFPGLSTISTYICNECGKAVEITQEWVELNDDTCLWMTFDNEEPIAVMRCVCGRHPDVDEDGVAYVCGRRSAVRYSGIVAAIIAWNELVDSGE
jgi:hypothetical protein